MESRSAASHFRTSSTGVSSCTACRLRTVRGDASHRRHAPGANPRSPPATGGRAALEFAAYHVVGRGTRRLLELCDHHGEPAADGVLITMPLSQHELAAWSASSREAVAKALHLLRELGWIETHRRRILARDLEALRKYAG
jgi:CRP-like cAMP-binding protein